MRPFLRWLGIKSIPGKKALRLTEQRIPGQSESAKVGKSGLPDAFFFTPQGDWAVLIESKLGSSLKVSQIKRHIRTAQRYGFDSPAAVVITVKKSACKLPHTICTTWQEVYQWFSRRRDSQWARTFVHYMRVFEAKMLAQGHYIKGTITMFDGLGFETGDYAYREAKRLIRLLGDELQGRKDLKYLGVDPKGNRRKAITDGRDGVWDFLPLRIARKAKSFTSYPHLTMVLKHYEAVAAITVPHRIKGGLKTKLKALGRDGFEEMMNNLERGLRPLVKKCKGAKPFVTASQRRYLSQRSWPETDGRVEADLRTYDHSGECPVKLQPQWMGAVYDLLRSKKSNIQLSVEVRFPYASSAVQSPKVADLFAQAWQRLWPVVEFVLE